MVRILALLLRLLWPIIAGWKWDATICYCAYVYLYNGQQLVHSERIQLDRNTVTSYSSAWLAKLGWVIADAWIVKNGVTRSHSSATYETTVAPLNDKEYKVCVTL